MIEEIDLIEEIARRRGYDSFGDELAPFRPSAVPEDLAVAVERTFREVLIRRGALEARTIALAPASAGAAAVLNPLSAEEAFLRTALLPGLLRRVEHNWAHGVRDVRLWEIGTVFRAARSGALPAEERRIAAVLSGARAPRHWTGDPGVLEVRDQKGVMEELAGRIRRERHVIKRDRVCMGTLISREQYLVDLEGGRRDGRLPPTGKMHPIDVAAWTAAIGRRQ